MSPLLIGAIILLALIKLYKWSTFRPEGCPPGPPRIPIIGNYLYLLLLNWNHIHKATSWMCKYYNSKIISLYLGPILAYAVNDSEAIKEVLYSSSYDGRPDLLLGRMRHPELKKKGIFFNDGPIWKEQRWFFLRYLRDYGFGRRFECLENVMQEEITDLISLMKEGPKYSHEHKYAKKNQIRIPYAISPFTTNSFFHMLFGQRYSRSEHAELLKFSDAAFAFTRNTNEYGRLISMLPWVRYIFPGLSGFKDLFEVNIDQYNFFKKRVEDRIATFKGDEDDMSFLDLFIKEWKQGKHDPESFEHDQFIMNCLDFSLPANVAISIQMTMFLQTLIRHPNIARNIQAEIDEVVGQCRLPTLDDRKNLPYTEACIREILRLETLVPSSIVHSSTEDTKLMGYNVPKDTPVFPGLYELHLDENLWDNPMSFKPERFLDSEGKFSVKLDKSLPFGAGRRLCAGETFARNMMFLISSAFLQNFNFHARPGQKIPLPHTHPVGIAVVPDEFWLSYTPRF
ncbi:hypothetical protein ACFFRR_011678 [Megaselia abdita]